MARPTTNLAVRFEEKISRIPEAGCWIWTGTVFISTGYGAIKAGGKLLLAHRVAWEIFNGAIPVDMKVLHTCDVKLCVNPAHLYLGTAADNIQDVLDRKGTSHYFNAAATHCIRGHPLSGPNLYMQGDMRVCRICKWLRRVPGRVELQDGKYPWLES